MDQYDQYEMNKFRPQLVVEEEDKVVANAYPGQRTEGTKDERTRVRVRIVSSLSVSLVTGADVCYVQRVFSFAQIFFFALTFMSSWETMALNLQAALYNGGPISLAWGSVDGYNPP